MIRIEEGTLVHADIGMDTDDSFRWQCILSAEAAELATRARAAGVILSISQSALQPLAMGNHVDVVTTYAARTPAGKGGAA